MVYASSEDGANFSEPKQLVPESENQTHDNDIDVCVDGGKIYVCWQDAAKIFASGADLNEAAGNQHISYAVVDAATGNVLSHETVTEEAGMNDNPVAEGGRIYWYADGNISYTTVGSTAVQQIYEEARPDVNSNFRVLSEGGERTEIIWDAIAYDTEKVALYGISSSGEGQWTSPYVIAQTDSEMTGTLTGSLQGGIPYIVYIHIRNQEDGGKSSSLCVMQKKGVTDLALHYAGYEYEDFKPGQFDIGQ